MAQLLIKRTKHWMHRKQPICIFCDEEYIDCVKNDATKTIDLEPGTHKVAVKMTSYRSRVVSVEVKDEKPTILELSFPAWLIFGDVFSAGIVALYFTLKLFIDMKQFNYLPPAVLAFAGLYMVYNMLYVRKRYFRLKELQ
ncbi:MAG: hypothetical protein ACERKD_01395 [Prolixibacteraceae bacterium]